MKHASIAELKARLSEFVAVVKRGEEVLITDRGRPVARLAPLTSDTAGDAHIEALLRSGAVRAPQRKLPRDFARKRMVPDPDGLLLSALLEEREDTR